MNGACGRNILERRNSRKVDTIICMQIFFQVVSWFFNYAYIEQDFKTPGRKQWLKAPEVGDGQGSLVCCSPWGRRVGHDWATEQQQQQIAELKRTNFWSILSAFSTFITFSRFGVPAQSLPYRWKDIFHKLLDFLIEVCVGQESWENPQVTAQVAPYSIIGLIHKSLHDF